MLRTYRYNQTFLWQFFFISLGKHSGIINNTFPVNHHTRFLQNQGFSGHYLKCWELTGITKHFSYRFFFISLGIHSGIISNTFPVNHHTWFLQNQGFKGHYLKRWELTGITKHFSHRFFLFHLENTQASLTIHFQSIIIHRSFKTKAFQVTISNVDSMHGSRNTRYNDLRHEFDVMTSPKWHHNVKNKRHSMTPLILFWEAVIYR